MSDSRQIVIAGGSGQIGAILARHYHLIGDDVVVLAREPRQTPWRTAIWDGRTIGAWAKEIDGADIVINLAGKNVNCRYNAANRREIIDSRVNATKIVGQAISQSSRPPKLWMNASTATIYRHAFDRPMDEATGELGGNEPNAPDTWRFSIGVAKSWEDAFFSSSAPSTRKIALRSAMVMSPDHGGVFDTLLGLVRRGLGGTAGSGKQFVSWIHDKDFLRSLDFLIDHEELDGAVNVASPNPLPNAAFMSALRKAWGMKIGLPASQWMLEIGAVLLRTETELILKSRRVIPGRLLAAGFQFEFPEWLAATVDLINRWKTPSNVA
ncbi:MAG: TIGR01777 family oxidoreductase [Candidatus Acidiferrales bacterium]